MHVRHIYETNVQEYNFTGMQDIAIAGRVLVLLTDKLVL